MLKQPSERNVSAAPKKQAERFKSQNKTNRSSKRKERKNHKSKSTNTLPVQSHICFLCDSAPPLPSDWPPGTPGFAATFSWADEEEEKRKTVSVAELQTGRNDAALIELLFLTV